MHIKNSKDHWIACNKLLIRVLPVAFSFVLATTSLAQDIQFSQFYAANLYLNPAFAGSNHTDRIAAHQRLQWPGLDAKYITSLFAFDTFWDKYKSSFGIYAFRDWQGSGDINSTELNFQYAYEMTLSKKISLRAGLQLGLVNRKLSYSDLLFPDQLNNNGLNGSMSYDHTNNNRISYADATSGMLLYSEFVWLSVSAHHLNRANQSFLDGTSRIPVKYAFAGGYKFILGTSQRVKSTIPQEFIEKSITPVFHYKFQGKSDQTDLGLIGDYERAVGGIWYRGIPYLKKYKEGLQNNESLVFLLGWKFDLIYVGYSYDVTLSKLAPVRTGGSHELHIRYHHQKRSPRKKPLKRLPCPDF